MEMSILVLGRKDDLRKMEQVGKDLKRICTEANVPAEIKLTHNFSEVPGQSFNPGATPIIFINQQVEFTGVTDPKLLKTKILQMRNMG